ncbi:hypothetical protein OAV31_00085 [bacterium]|nr:hypothetical protein [bacterium]
MTQQTRTGFQNICAYGLVHMLFVSLLFCISSLGLWLLDVTDNVLLLAPNITFSAACGLFFLFSVHRGWILLPLTWFILGSGLFFGLGPTASVFGFNAWDLYVFGDRVDYIRNVNLISSLSILLVLSVASLFYYNVRPVPRSYCEIGLLSGRQNKFVFLCFLCIYCLILFKLWLFQSVDSLYVRSLLDKAFFFIPGLLTFFGIVYPRLSLAQKMLSILSLVCLTLIGLLSFSKYEILAPLLAFGLGIFVKKCSFKTTIMAGIFAFLLFFLSTNFVNLGRAHPNYLPSQNVSERVMITRDVIFNPTQITTPGVLGVLPLEQKLRFLNNFQTNYPSIVNPLIAMFNRFNFTPVQGFLIEEHIAGRHGISLDKFWQNLIPRLVWPSKPLMTNHGNELSAYYFKNPDQGNSSLAPSYVGDAYWNFGLWGVICVSIYLGVVFGFWGRIALKKVNQPFNAYPFFGFHVIFTAFSVESWVGSTFLGGVITTLILFVLVHLAFHFLKLET